ncbi:hypothetical protein ATANTOWER_014403 [Ataeniobius toweri]|uniref:Uncharacterized protein n=1 Tax=Ataeniobius toweri TaxID=208326 RepID=A0ABU7C857_9TELE|nr:hypothetical protein [Ataeniobius toweri]
MVHSLSLRVLRLWCRLLPGFELNLADCAPLLTRFLSLAGSRFLQRCWSSQVCWVTSATYSTDYFKEYLSRRQPALRRQSVLPSVIETLNFGFTSLSTDYLSGSFLDNQDRKRTLSTLQRKHLHTGLIPVCSKLVHTLDPSTPSDLTTPFYC